MKEVFKEWKGQGDGGMHSLLSNKPLPSDKNRGRSAWVRRSPCYLCTRFGSTARDHGIPYPCTDELERKYKLNQKH